jgi:Sulfotransferase domain
MTASPSDVATRAATGDGRLPDFFIVGHPKSGTTALYEMLRRHPQIYMPDLKEPGFLAPDMRPRFTPTRSPALPQTVEQYLALFAAAEPGQLTGEATSSYLLSREAARSIAGMSARARAIAVLREPASFLVSLHLQLQRVHIENRKDLLQALRLEPERRAGRRIPRRCAYPQLLAYSQYVRYTEQLRRYHDALSGEQVLVLIYEEFRDDNEATVRAVRRFLGVDECPPVRVVDANPTNARIRSQNVDELLNRVSVGRGPASRAVKRGVKMVTSHGVRRAAVEAVHRHVVNGKPRPADERLLLELRRRFKSEVVALSEYLGRDLVAMWGYDDLA